MQVSEASIFVDAGTDITDTAKYMEGMPAEAVAGAYAFYDEHRTLQFVGISQNLRYQFEVPPRFCLCFEIPEYSGSSAPRSCMGIACAVAYVAWPAELVLAIMRTVSTQCTGAHERLYDR